MGGRQSKSVTATYGAVSVALLIVIATVALIVKPPSPPALAEFAPQADKTIDEGPDDQSSQFGLGSGACTAGQVGCEGLGEPPPPPPEEEGDGDNGPTQRPVYDKARIKHCIGDPPRQIEDPQSPPCADYWEGPDNGGATSPGVTRDEIRVAISHGLGQYDTNNEIQGLAEFFHDRFELYGRRLTLVKVQPQWPNRAGMVAAADHAAESKVFASLGFGNNGSMLPWRERLAKHRIVSVSSRDPYTTESDLARLHPYAWSYTQSYDTLGRDLGEFICQSLNDSKAEHGGTAVKDLTRKFAVLNGKEIWAPNPHDPQEGEDRPPDIGPAVQVLKACDAPLTMREFNYGDDKDGQEALLRQLQEDDVTTVVVNASSPAQAVGQLMDAALRVRYEPEWLLIGDGEYDYLGEDHWQARPPTQTAHMLAMGGWNKHLPHADRPSTWAYKESGQAPPRYHNTHEADFVYHALLVLASGIQAAGPNLTPASFARGLQGLTFPNPGAGAAPYYQAHVGFTGDHSMMNDEGLAWWSPSAQAYYSLLGNKGGWCWIDLGARWRMGKWPKRRVPFQDPEKPCR